MLGQPRSKVSIVMSFLDAQRFMPEAVTSVRQQTHTDWELLMVDDGSTDGSSAYARALADQDPAHFKYLQHPGHVNRGLSASRNVGLQEATGEFLAFLDSDDVWLPDKLARQIDLLQQHPEAGMVYGPLVFWYGWTGQLSDAARDFVVPMGGVYDTLIPAPRMLRRQVDSRDGLPGMCSVLMRRETAVQVGGFESSFPGMYEDEAFFSKIALRWPVYIMADPLDRYRQHADSFCARAYARGEYSMNPGVENKARYPYLRWLETHVSQSGLDVSGELGRAIRAQLLPYELAWCESARPEADMS
jgi:glycosyltransferase involved in cell wall biosynthesis